MTEYQLIQRFDVCIKQYCPFVYAYYNEPLADREIIGYMNEFKLDVEGMSSFKKIYEWKNGIDVEVQDYSKDLRILDVGNFLTIKDAKALIVTNSESDYGWHPLNLVPIVANFEGEYLLVDVDKNSMTHGMIKIYSPNLMYNDPVTTYDSLQQMLITIIKLFESKAQAYDNETKQMVFNFDMIYKISRLLNPNSERWRV